jgi:hypothetical protein
MTPEQFVYWLQGFMEIADPEALSTRQIDTIRDHLDLVLNKVTPNRSESIGTTTWPPKSTADWLRTQTACTATADPRQIRLC